MERIFKCGRYLLLTVIAALLSAQLAAQTPTDPRAIISIQRIAMEKFARMDGVWRGSAWTILPSADKHSITQTERIGPFLDGSIRVIEGRGYESDGRVGFNAFGVISYIPESKTYRLRSHAQGRYGDFAITPTEDGYVWEIPMGSSTLRYTASINGDVFKEVGDRIEPGKAPFRMFEMTLSRIGDTEWPAGNPVPAR